MRLSKDTLFVFKTLKKVRAKNYNLIDALSLCGGRPSSLDIKDKELLNFVEKELNESFYRFIKEVVTGNELDKLSESMMCIYVGILKALLSGEKEIVVLGMIRECIGNIKDNNIEIAVMQSIIYGMKSMGLVNCTMFLVDTEVTDLGKCFVIIMDRKYNCK